MTLILTAATGAFVVHASDRLLTKRIGARQRVHSDTENKSLIVCAHDAICVIGYTGTAYIGDVITDEWIASTITGLDLGNRFMLRQGRIQGLYLNTVLRRLENGLSNLVLPGSANYLGISVSGVRQRRRYVRPFIREFERNRGVVRSYGYMRYPRSPNFHQLSQIGASVPMSSLQRTIGEAFPQYGISAEAFRLGMINVIRRQAKSTNVVGDEVMTVTITRPPEGWDVTWTFESTKPRYAALSNSKGEVQSVFRSCFSPWIISPSGISRPSVGTGHFDHMVGNVKIRCGNEYKPRSGDGLLFAASSQERAPRR